MCSDAAGFYNDLAMHALATEHPGPGPCAFAHFRNWAGRLVCLFLVRSEFSAHGTWVCEHAVGIGNAHTWCAAVLRVVSEAVFPQFSPVRSAPADPSPATSGCLSVCVVIPDMREVLPCSFRLRPVLQRCDMSRQVHRGVRGVHVLRPVCPSVGLVLELDN